MASEERTRQDFAKGWVFFLTRSSPYVTSLKSVLNGIPPLYVNFINFKKAFDGVHLKSLWKILRAYGIASKMANIIRKFCEHLMQCHPWQHVTQLPPIKTRVRQGCILSPILFHRLDDASNLLGESNGLCCLLWSHVPDEPMKGCPKLHWDGPHIGKRKRGGPKNIWRRTVKMELKEMGPAWA